MLKIVYPICCGLDVHKKFIYACIATTNSKGITEYLRQRFSAYTGDLIKMLEWLTANKCFHVCMESTGKYWIPVYNILESCCQVTLAHPKYVKAIRGKKTDKKDAQWIADLFKHDLVAPSFIPPTAIRELRDLMRYRIKLTNIDSGEKNRIQNCLTVSNIQLANVVSDTFGKSSMKIIHHLLSNPYDKKFDLAPLLHPSMLKKEDDIRRAIDGIISPEQHDKMKVILQHHQELEQCKSRLESIIISLAKPYTKQISLVSTAPGFKNIFSAITVISEIGADMTVFPTSKHLCSWAGLAPQNNESGGKKHSVNISRAGIYLKPLLVQCANGVVKSDMYPEIKGRYLSIKKRRGHKRAIIAVARMLLTAIYYILKNSEPYNPKLYKKAESNPLSREISVEQAILMAQRQGYSVIA